MFIKTDNENNVIIYPYTLDIFRQENKNVSLPRDLNNRFLARHNVFPVYAADKPNYDEITQFLVPDLYNPYPAGNNEWKYDWIVNEKTPEQIEFDTNRKAAEIRAERDSKLAECDWVSIRSSDTGEPVDTPWAVYRQSLRDITNQEGFPWNVVWPQKQ